MGHASPACSAKTEKCTNGGKAVRDVETNSCPRGIPLHGDGSPGFLHLGATPMQQLRRVALLGAVLAFHAQGCVAAEPQTLDANGVKIRYYVQGKGEPVVLIHGWLSSAGINWDLFGTTALLAKDFQVITLDVRGHGRSDKPLNEKDYGPELVEDVVRLLDHLKIKKAHIVGYSMGGIITGSFIANHPDRALSGTLCGMAWMEKNGLAAKGFEMLLKKEPKAKAQAAAICFRSLATLGVTKEQVQAIKVPVAVLAGDKDGIADLYIEPTEKVRKDWPVIRIKDADHLNCIAKPQFKEELKKWLDKQVQH
jgi:pimeloyl-ACP methyl ester carboxylesterase